MDDLISRQAAIDAAKDWYDGLICGSFKGLKKRLEALPSAQPTVDAVPVIRCRDCKFLRFTGTVWKCQNRLVMMLCDPNDYCSRAERKEE
jgi:hypothetical protein